MGKSLQSKMQMDDLTMVQRFLFWVQSPLAILFGVGIFFSIPSSFTSGQDGDADTSISSKLANIDYLGALTLVRLLISCSGCH
jgi:hypothetical protein